MKNIHFGKKAGCISIILVLLISATIRAGYENFHHHKNTVIRQQQEHLLTIAKSISRTINTYLKDKGDSLSILVQNPIITEVLKNSENQEDYRQHEEILKAFYERYSDKMDRLFLLDKNGILIYQYPDNTNMKEKIIDTSILHHVLESQHTLFTREYESSSNEFSIDILQPIIVNNETHGILISTINLNKLYNTLIHPIRPGKKGYAMVKNRNGIIIMHPVTEQIGIESIKVRKKKFPEFDWKELEELNHRQIEEKEGYHIYHSKWWQEKEMKRVKKINAYTNIDIDNTSWIISVQMDYGEIEEPIRGTLINISSIALIITTILLMVLYIILNIDKKRKSLEIEAKYLKQLNKTYEDLIKSEARLRHSQKLQTIGTLTSGIIHEFRNLLAPILGYSEILLQETNDKAFIEDIWEIRKSALAAKELVEHTLAFSRNGDITTNSAHLKMEDIIEESIKLIQPILPKNIKIVKNIDHNGLIFGSITQLQQVLLNLYTNAYQAMKSNGGILELNVETVHVCDDLSNKLELIQGEYVRVQVKDTGVGMEEKTLVQIFDPFFTTKETGEGTGLGLSVVHGIIKNHKGAITVKSQIHVGTTVEVYLPISENI